jgi:hypothetical protein
MVRKDKIEEVQLPMLQIVTPYHNISIYNSSVDGDAAIHRIAVDTPTLREIEALKEHPRETNGDVVRRALEALKAQKR